MENNNEKSSKKANQILRKISRKTIYVKNQIYYVVLLYYYLFYQLFLLTS